MESDHHINEDGELERSAGQRAALDAQQKRETELAKLEDPSKRRETKAVPAFVEEQRKLSALEEERARAADEAKEREREREELESALEHDEEEEETK
jgi:hypothetical protein